MNLSLPAESNTSVKEMYKSLSPKRARTFSEKMSRLRQPFLCSENDLNSSIIFKSPKKKLRFPHEHSEFNNNNNKMSKDTLKSNLNTIDANKVVRKFVNAEFLKKLSDKYQNLQKTTFEIKNQKDEKKFGTSKESTSAGTDESTVKINSTNSGYYSEESINETNSCLESETSLNQLDEQLKPLINSTFISEKETTGFSETINDSETFSIENIISNRETIENKRQPNKSMQNNEQDINLCPAFKAQNFQIPLIIINEVEMVENSIGNDEDEDKKLKTLKIPVIPTCTEFEENKELQEKLLKKERAKLIITKDNVMAQLLENAQSTDFPKLKHICNTECEKDTDGSCKKLKQNEENNAKQQTESNGLFSFIWNTIKYALAGKEQKTPKTKKDKEKNNKDNKKTDKSQENNVEEDNGTTLEGKKESSSENGTETKEEKKELLESYIIVDENQKEIANEDKMVTTSNKLGTEEEKDKGNSENKENELLTSYVIVEKDKSKSENGDKVVTTNKTLENIKEKNKKEDEELEILKSTISCYGL